MENVFTAVEAESSLWYVIVCEPDYPNRFGRRGITDIAVSCEHALEILGTRVLTNAYHTPSIIIPLELSGSLRDQTLPRWSDRYGRTHSRSNQVNITLSDRAWNYFQLHTKRLGYEGKGKGHGASAYILALLKANPTHNADEITTHWRDTRNPDLRSDDAARIKKCKMPVWADTPATYGGEDARKMRAINAYLAPEIEQRLYPLAAHFLIGPARGKLTKASQAYATLEAIGCGHLTPLNQAPPCDNPVTSNRDRLRHKNIELSF